MTVGGLNPRYYLLHFEYASRGHVVMELLWDIGMCLGALHLPEIKDYDREEQYLEIHHRVETDPPLRTGDEGVRTVVLTETVCETLDDWIEHQRPDVTDEHARNPLITSEQGRRWKTNIHEAVYRATRSCYVRDECPNGEGRTAREQTTGPIAPVIQRQPARSPSGKHHTHRLCEALPEKVVSDWMNIDPDLLDIHYDKGSEEQKVEQHRGYLDNIKLAFFLRFSPRTQVISCTQ